MGVRTQLLAGALGVSTGAVVAPGNVTGIPDRALVAYVEAAQSADACPGMHWSIVAGIYRQESNHGRYGGASIDDDGMVLPRIRNLESGAMGAGQFINSSWPLYSKPGDDPDDIDDAARATVRHLCKTFGDVEGDRLRGAIASYYGADVDGYADSVLASIEEYRRADVTVETPKGKERSLGRLGSNLWAGMVRGWLRTGQAADTVGAGGAWRAVDDAAFGTDRLPAARANTSRSDKLESKFGAALDAMLAEGNGRVAVIDGWRSPADQKVMWDRFQEGTGNPAFWSDGVTCESRHCTGQAADLAGDIDWAHENAARFGLVFPYAHERWHVELAG